MAKELSVSLNGEQKILEIREGQALPLHELRTLEIKGSIIAPGDFVQTRKSQFPIDATHVLVNRDEGWIMAISQDREDVGKILIKGEIKLHPDFVRIGINDQSTGVRTTTELAAFIKMNRSFFGSKSTAMNLVSLLRNFKATVTKQLEDKIDDRANYSVLRQQVVESNIPEAFEITVPLFVGEKPEKFLVELVIDPEDLTCALISPEVVDIIREKKEKYLNKEIERFVGYVIIYK